ncbi:hypothetical protein Theth_0680 [Pseudothermotoga thermarum DSM 5069]|uniref:Uncharacterized protein n=1 Tax=Pseudothermotoga thermarum DSM 5069 TaxID=688269 RepID=F7YXW7_9THEM|nr:hypothetical protein Theth_0680 [Pseudothermotoga thermarum DSM 5069]
MNKKISLIGVLTLLVVIILALRFSEKPKFSFYFECNEQLKKSVFDLLAEMKIKYRLLERPDERCVQVFDDRIIGPVNLRRKTALIEEMEIATSLCPHPSSCTITCLC